MPRSPSPSRPQGSETPRPPPLPDDAGEVLIGLARAAIADELGIDVAADASPPWLHFDGACFVTLTTAGRLSGCIGSLEAERPLLADVRSNARAAAFRDRRFPRLTEPELEHTTVDVAVLSGASPMAFTDEEDALGQLRPHVDGVVLAYGDRRATLLPRVWGHLPDPRDFLAALKQKSGLPRTFSIDQVRLSRFTVSEFREGGDRG